MTQQIPIFFADAFTETPFEGNPAAVCFLEQDLPIDIMQKIGGQANLAATALITKLKVDDSFENSNNFGIRWFTPTAEVHLCGHATLAASKILFECYGNKNPELTYQSHQLGIVKASQQGDGLIVLDFPNQDPHKVEVVTESMTKFLEEAASGRKVLDVQFSPPTKKLLVRLEDSISRSEFESLRPSVSRLEALLPDIKGLILTAKGNSNDVDAKGRPYDFFSRFFAPWDGVNEDPVCGSAHAVLTPFWARVLHKTDLYGRQCSKRGGEILVKVRDSERVNIGGKVRIVIRGTMYI